MHMYLYKYTCVHIYLYTHMRSLYSFYLITIKGFPYTLNLVVSREGRIKHI